MKKKSFILLVIVFVYFPSFSQQNEKDTSLFTDDPIAAMLDSLSRLKFFSMPDYSQKNKYNFPIDSVPSYSDSVYTARLARLSAQSPFNLSYNPLIRGYIELYASRKRQMTSRMLGLAHLYFPMFEEVLDRHNLPLELKHLAIVESALNPTARSRAGAMGLWQFMYGTGKMMGLKITSYVDERCDPYKSTVAACEYLQFLYDMFGEWEMALAAYNAGPGNVSKAIRRSGGKTSYWDIRPYLPRETQGYVPAFIAVNYIMNYWEEHNLYPTPPTFTFADIDTISIRRELSFHQIAKALNMPVEEVQYLNPCYKRGTIPFSEEDCYTLCLPIGKIGSFITNEQQIYEYAMKDSLMQALALQEVKRIHTVRKGEVISTVAKRYNCTPEDIKAWNRLKSTKLTPGQKLTVYVSEKNNSTSPQVKTTAAADTTSAKTKTEVNPSSNAVEGGVKYYTVRSGDSLWIIAQKHGVTIDQIKQWNNLANADKIIPGQKLKIYTNG